MDAKRAAGSFPRRAKDEERPYYRDFENASRSRIFGVLGLVDIEPASIDLNLGQQPETTASRKVRSSNVSGQKCQIKCVICQPTYPDAAGDGLTQTELRWRCGGDSLILGQGHGPSRELCP